MRQKIPLSLMDYKLTKVDRIKIISHLTHNEVPRKNESENFVC